MSFQDELGIWEIPFYEGFREQIEFQRQWWCRNRLARGKVEREDVIYGEMVVVAFGVTGEEDGEEVTTEDGSI